jgi:hypothetical protein
MAGGSHGSKAIIAAFLANATPIYIEPDLMRDSVDGIVVSE